MTSGTGSCSVIANQAGNANYAAAAQVSETTSATKASQAINVTTAPPPTATKGSIFTIDASASSGLAVTFASSGKCTNSMCHVHDDSWFGYMYGDADAGW